MAYVRKGFGAVPSTQSACVAAGGTWSIFGCGMPTPFGGATAPLTTTLPGVQRSQSAAALLNSSVPGCNPGYSYNSVSGVCESDASYTDGAMCFASSFPWLGAIDATQNYDCVAGAGSMTPIILLGVAAAFGLALLKGGRR